MKKKLSLPRGHGQESGADPGRKTPQCMPIPVPASRDSNQANCAKKKKKVGGGANSSRAMGMNRKKCENETPTH